LASCTQLSDTVRNLSDHFAAADHVIDGLDDAGSKNRLNHQLMELRSNALAAAMHELSQALKKLPTLLTIQPKAQNV
jgi:hypothetical protein